MAFYQQLNRGVRRPSLYLFLDLDPVVAAARAGASPADRWEQPSVAGRVRGAYQNAIALVERTEAARVVRIDAAQPQARMLEAAVDAVMRFAAGGVAGTTP